MIVSVLVHHGHVVEQNYERNLTMIHCHPTGFDEFSGDCVATQSVALANGLELATCSFGNDMTYGGAHDPNHKKYYEENDPAQQIAQRCLVDPL